MKIPISTYRKPIRRPKTVRRLRLLDLIHQNIQHKLTFLCAPAGYGKTTLLIDYAEDTDANIAWCRLGPEDESLAYFFGHLVLALRSAWPAFGKNLEELYLQEVPPSPRVLATELVNAVEASIQDFTLFILDDYQAISSNLSIVAFIEHFLDLLPDQLRLIIGSRSVYGIPSASLYVNEELAVINAEDLHFLPDEVKDLARRRFQIHLSDQQAGEIIQQSEGWIMSILLVLQDWKPASGLLKVTEAKEHLFQYLAKEIFSQLPGKTQTFLLRTALCERFDLSLANTLLETGDAKKVIQDLENANLFIFSVRDGGETTYQYHQLFREFLIGQINDQPPSERARVHAHIAAWYEIHGFARDGIRHYLLAGQFEQSAAIMDAQAKSMYISGEEEALQDWYQTLSQMPALLQKAPDLILNWVKVKTNQGKMEGCLDLLDIAEPVFLANGRFDNLANLLVVRGMILRFQSEFGKAIEIAERTLTLVETQQLDPYYKYQALRLEGLGQFHTGQTELAWTSIHKALSGFRELFKQQSTDRLKHDLIQSLTDIGMMSLLTGNMFSAQGSFEEALSISLTLRSNRGDLANCANNRAYLAFLMGDFRESWKYYEQGLVAAREVDWVRSIVQILNGQAELLTLVDEFDMAANLLQKAMQAAQSIPNGKVSPATYREMAELEKWKGNYSQALYYLREAAQITGEDSDNPGHLIRIGSVHAAMEEWEVAQETLTKALLALESEKSANQLRALDHFYLAESCFHFGQAAQAREHLRKALAESTRLGHDTFLVSAIRRSPEFVKHIADDWKNNHLVTLIQKAMDFPNGYHELVLAEKEASREERYSLQVKAFGEPEIRLDSVLLPTSNWQSAGARALFFYILDHRQVRRDDLGAVFWPEFSAAKVNSNFHATLWRVRNAIGKKDVVAFDGQYYSIDERVDLFYDVAEFENLVKLLERPNISETVRRSTFAQAVDLYSGDFLSEIDMAWSDLRRLELKQKYLLTLEQYATYELENNHLREAKRLYEKAIELDPFQDQLHLGLMRCLVQLNLIYAARLHFEEYRSTLMNELGNEPMPELQAFINERAR